jgi:ABC-type nitrate/sulfonate/bicarbonate transport system substrate-binding protein
VPIAFARMLVAAAIAVLGAPFTSSGAALAQPAREAVTIGLASSSLAVASGRIAKELGLFEKHGLDARFVIMDNSSAAIAGLLSGSFPATISGVPELVIAQSRGQNVVAIATTYGGFATSLVLSSTAVDKLGVQSTAPVKERLKALDGLRIATASATAIGSITFKNAVRAAGATVRLVTLTQPAMPAALESGAVDGFLSSAPFWAVPVAKGKGVLWISGPQGEFPAEFTPRMTAQLQMKRDYAEAHPDLVTRLRAVVDDLAAMVEKQPAATKAAVARLYPDLDAATLDILFASEAHGLKSTRRPSVDDMAREIALVKLSGAQAPDIDRVNPGALLLP